MSNTITTPEAYIAQLPEERVVPMQQLRETIMQHLPNGFEETIAYGMITYVVSHNIYPKGYHCDAKQALPFISLASQKNFIAIYHMGLYANPDLLAWFTNAYAALNIGKLDMGKSCIRFKKTNAIPYELIAELCTKLTVQDWIREYESKFKH